MKTFNEFLKENNLFVVQNYTLKIISICSFANLDWCYQIAEECFSYKLISPELEDEILKSLIVGLFS